MKAGLLAIAALSAAASAQVHRQVHRHPHKRDNVVYETAVEYVTAPNVVVYVDANGKPISTAFNGQPAPTPDSYQAPAAPAPAPPAYVPAPAAPAPAPAAPAPAADKPKEQPKPQGYTPKAAEPGKTSGAPAPAGDGYGIVYSPYRDNGGCKTQDEVNSDFSMINDYSLVRIYGTDCDQVKTVKNVAKDKKFKIFAGIFDIDNCEAEAQKIIDAVEGDWSCIDTVSVGNELVNNGQKSAEQVVAALNKVRGQLKGAGYNGNVVIVDTFVAMIANPSLCEASDYAAANCHAYFDGARTAEQAGDFVLEQSKRVQEACGGKRVVITETGWPWQGATNGAAVASKENQKIVIDSLRSKFTKDIILFTAFDDKWKSDFAGSHGAEQFWGFIDRPGAPASY